METKNLFSWLLEKSANDIIIILTFGEDTGCITTLDVFLHLR